MKNNLILLILLTFFVCVSFTRNMAYAGKYDNYKYIGIAGDGFSSAYEFVQAHANTVQYVRAYGGTWWVEEFTVSLDKGLYAPGETIHVSGLVFSSKHGPVSIRNLRVDNLSLGIDLVSMPPEYYPEFSLTDSTIFVAPLSPGNYTLSADDYTGYRSIDDSILLGTQTIPFTVTGPSFIDIGLRVNQGTSGSPDIQHIAIEDPAGLPPASSPLMIAKGGTSYHVSLVDVSDVNATKLRIKLTDGSIKALRSCTATNGCVFVP